MVVKQLTVWYKYDVSMYKKETVSNYVTISTKSISYSYSKAMHASILGILAYNTLLINLNLAFECDTEHTQTTYIL